MTFHLVAVGRVRNTALRDACEEYLARSRRYFSIDIREVPPAVRGGRSAPNARRQEAEGLLRAIPGNGTLVALTRTGRSEDSIRFAERLARWQRDARDVVWVIGGANGLDPSVLERCPHKISLSPLTLPHEVARLVLLEQIYRAGTILRREPYHKGPR
jgi:23S rRNA (pseudouridine1915-N3)-methyltransferase